MPSVFSSPARPRNWPPSRQPCAPRRQAKNARHYREDNVNACATAAIDPLIAIGREVHHPSLDERFAPPPPAPENPTPLQAMEHRLKTQEGKKRYAPRKQIPEPVFGIIKSVLGFRQFLLRGIDRVRGEWTLLTMAWNVKPMFVLAGAK